MLATFYPVERIFGHEFKEGHLRAFRKGERRVVCSNRIRQHPHSVGPSQEFDHCPLIEPAILAPSLVKISQGDQIFARQVVEGKNRRRRVTKADYLCLRSVDRAIERGSVAHMIANMGRYFFAAPQPFRFKLPPTGLEQVPHPDLEGRLRTVVRRSVLCDQRSVFSRVAENKQI